MYHNFDNMRQIFAILKKLFAANHKLWYHMHERHCAPAFSEAEGTADEHTICHEEDSLNNKKKFNYWSILLYVIIIAAVAIFVATGNDEVNKKPEKLEYAVFFDKVKSGFGENLGDANSKIYAVQITEETLFGIYTEGVTENEIKTFEKGKTYDFYVTVSSSEAFMNEMSSLISTYYNVEKDSVTVLDYGFNCKLNPAPTTPWILTLLPTILLVGALVFVFVMINKTQNKQGASFTKSRARTADELGNKVTFADVAGADEEKQELREVVDFLRSPKAFIEMGARIPKGVLLVGPPGTGKTLLAKAVAGEAHVPFFTISASEFLELYVGVGAGRVRDLFQTAKRCAPAIIFIDEIDAVGRQRGAGVGGGHDEREQALNQLLVEMDGFTNSQGIVVIAATNRPDVLDSALLRPGRFDRRVTVDYPDVKGREEILQVHASKKAFEPSVSLHKIAQLTPGCTGADLENILNEAAILAVRNGHNSINNYEIDEAIKRVLYGPEKRSRVITKEDLRVTAYHEVGHAVVAHCLPHCDPVHELSVIPRGKAAGYTRTIPEDVYEHTSRGKLLDFIAMALGGRAAEALMLDDICTGASNDIQRATQIAHSIVTEYGMSDAIGPVYLAGEQEVFIGKSWGQQRNYSEDVAARVDTEVRRIMEEQSERAMRVLDEHRDAVERVVSALLEREQLTSEEFVILFDGGTLPPVHTEKLIKPDEDNDKTGKDENHKAEETESGADKA